MAECDLLKVQQWLQTPFFTAQGIGFAQLSIISSTLLLTPQVHMANRQATRDIALQVSLPFPVPGPGRARRRRQPRRAAVRARLPAQVRTEPLLRRGAIQGTAEPRLIRKIKFF